MREYFTLHRSVFPSYLTVESGRINSCYFVQGQFLANTKKDTKHIQHKTKL